MKDMPAARTGRDFLLRFLGNISQPPLLPLPWREEPVVFTDVGARGGPPAAWLRLSDEIQYLCFEPDPCEAQALREHFSKYSTKQISVIEAALGAQNGIGRLFLTKYRPSSSLLQPNHDFLNQLRVGNGFEVEDEVQINLTTLDHVLSTHGKRCDFLKVDVQGYELEVLFGGIRAIRQIIGCELEVSFVEIYRNQPLFAEIDQWMRAQGFFLADLERFWWQRRRMPRPYQERGTLAYGNAFYLKRDALQPAEPREAFRATIICLGLGLDELAFELVLESEKRGWISRQARLDFSAWIQIHRRASAFWFKMGNALSLLPGRRTLGRWLGLWSRALHGNSDTGSDADSWNRRTSW